MLKVGKDIVRRDINNRRTQVNSLALEQQLREPPGDSDCTSPACQELASCRWCGWQ